MPVYFLKSGSAVLCKAPLQDVVWGAARLGMELVGEVHLVALRLPMQREESRRIAKLYEFTGKPGLGSIVWAVIVG